MMKPEQKLWRNFAKPAFDNLRGWAAYRIENKAGIGMPDVYARNIQSKCSAWVELKVGKLAADGETILCDHLTGHQKCWLKSQWQAERNGFLLLQVDQGGARQTAFLLDGLEASQGVHKATVSELMSRSIYSCRSAKELLLRMNLTATILAYQLNH